MEILRETTRAQEIDKYSRSQIARSAALLKEVLAAEGPRTRQNTLEPLDELFVWLGNAWNAAALLRSVHPDPEVRRAAEANEQEIARFWNDLALNRELYEVCRAYDRSELDPEGVRMIEHVLRDFHRAGVDREEAVRERVRQLRQELVSVGQDFLRNILSDVREVALDGVEELEGLPDDYIRQHPPGPDGKIRITTDYPDYTPFMSYSRSGERRYQLYAEFRRRAYPANLEVLDRLLRQRHELATLLGYPSWAAYVTEDKMIETPEAVAEFIERVTAVAKARARREYGVLLEQKRGPEPTATAVGDWEKAFYEQMVRLERFRVDSKKIRAYFEYRRVRAGILALVSELFGVRFEPVADAPRWHPEVEVLDIFEDGERVGRIYLDMHPRGGKFKHAAMFPVSRAARDHVLPEAALVCNFPNPQNGRGPALLEHEDVITLFHEFGHLLHHVFARESAWARFNGTATEWDFVEVPSQLFEEWAWDYDVLSRFAVHHETGETIPRELVSEMRRARDFGRALGVCHQMFYAALSLSFYNQDPDGLDTNRLVEELQNRYSLFEFVGNTYFQASFGHLDDYSALYYTYMWSLVIEKDLFQEFRDRGVLDLRTARRFRTRVLGPGGSRDAKDLIRDFLGRDYSFDAFARWLEGDS